MAETSQFAQEDISRLCEEYATPYHAIIREHIVMGVTRYFLERWVPVLGVAPATVVNTLRQLNFHTPNQPITISGNALAREAAMSRRHLYTCLENAWIAAFVQVQPGKRTRNQSGKVLQEANKYSVRMDDPLSPADAYSLMLHLKEWGKTPLEAAKNAMEHQPRDLWASSPTTLPSEHFLKPEPITARDVLTHAFPNWQPANAEEEYTFEQSAHALHNHMILGRSDGRVSKIIVPQYFRTRWWKHLGHDLAWSYLWLRGAVYDNPAEGITRYNCWVPSLAILLELINRPREWWRRNVERPTPKSGVGGAADFFQQIGTQKGRDLASPQSVARQFRVRIEIPIAPSDRTLYSDLLLEWPDDQLDPFAATQVLETHVAKVRHIQTHRQEKGLPHLNTRNPQGSATFEHTEPTGVCHIQTQGSATFEHRDSESIKALSTISTLKKNQHKKFETTTYAAAKNEITTNFLKESETLLDQLIIALEKNPETPLHQISSPSVWLQQAWPEPINPHTPAWTAVNEKRVSDRDMLALMLSISADRSIEHRPRYLSWLVQQWQSESDNLPVANWHRWQKLADLPISEWNTRGRAEWIELTSADNRELPFGLEILFQLHTVEQNTRENFSVTADAKKRVGAKSETDHGLTRRVGSGEISIQDIWRAALGQLSIKLHKSIYTNWVEGTHPVSYHDGVLTLRARHFMAREQLTRRYNGVIEETVSDLAKEKITIRYVLHE